MDKSGKITVEVACGLIVAACTLLCTSFMIWLEYRTSMIAVVEGGQWKAPQSVVTELKAVVTELKAEDVNKITAMDPNRMTAVDANAVGSLYLVNICNKGKRKTLNTQMTMPRAVYWEVSWLCEDGDERTKPYSKAQLIQLPGIQYDRDVDVKVWAACKPTRSHAKTMKITHDDGYSARLDIRSPAWPLALYLSQRTSKVVKICAIVLLSVLLILIKTPIQKRYLRWKSQQPV